MSENPYEQPTADSSLKPFPTDLMVICIICLVLGVFGMFGTCMGGIGIAGSFFSDMIPDEEIRKNMNEQMSVQFVPLVIQVLLGVVLSPLMVVACIGCLTRKDWGRSLCAMACIGFVIWNVLSIGASIWLLVFHTDVLAKQSMPTFGEETAKHFVFAGQIVGIMMALLFIGFYIFAAIYMKRKTTIDFFDGKQA